MTKPRVLFIDDDPALCRLAQMHLERGGYAVEIASDGAGGIARIVQGGIDVVALDHYMPNLDGMETLAAICALADPPPVIYVTALQEARIAVAALKAGAADYVAKTAHGEFFELLCRAIDDAMESVHLRRAKDTAEAESLRNWHLTQSIVDTIRDPLVVLEYDMTIVMASQAFLKMFGITEAEARGRRLSELGQHQWDVPALGRLMEKVLPDDTSIEGFEIEDDFPGLGRRVFNLNARKISRPGNHIHRLLLVFEDITDRKQRERDAETLTNEISHRIKNNLQLVVGLIAFESRSASAPCVPGYRAMQARIGAIAELYDLISHASDGDAIALDAYLGKIAEVMTASLLGPDSGIMIEVEAAPLTIDPTRAVPFGLLVNELATNAVKHAFPDGKGRIVLSVREIAGQVELTVADDGVGIVEKTATKTEKRGFDYVAIFVRQLGGVVSTPAQTPGSMRGTTVCIRFPLLVAPPEHTLPAAA